jgi:hypothetical protein
VSSRPVASQVSARRPAIRLGKAAGNRTSNPAIMRAACARPMRKAPPPETSYEKSSVPLHQVGAAEMVGEVEVTRGDWPGLGQRRLGEGRQPEPP